MHYLSILTDLNPYVLAVLATVLACGRSIGGSKRTEAQALQAQYRTRRTCEPCLVPSIRAQSLLMLLIITVAQAT